MDEQVKHTTREQWLQAAVELARPLFKAHNYDIPPVTVSTGWPSQRGLSDKKKVVGECWDKSASEDKKTAQIFISPLLLEDNSEHGVLSTLVHELVHAVVGNAQGHGTGFKRCALAVGLVGKMTSCGAGPDLLVRFRDWEIELGPYPHQKINPGMSGKKKQTTRMIKCECDCGFIVRASKKALLEIGAPLCPHNKLAMTFDIPDEGDE